MFKDGKNFIEFDTRLNFMSPLLQIGHQHHIQAYNGVCDRLECHKHAEDTFLLPTSSNGHQHNDVTNITVTSA